MAHYLSEFNFFCFISLVRKKVFKLFSCNERNKMVFFFHKVSFLITFLCFEKICYVTFLLQFIYIYMFHFFSQKKNVQSFFMQ